MNATTCAALTAVFPLILITVLIEGRSISSELRKSNWYTWPVGFGVVLSAAGMILTVIGVQADGLTGGADVLTWVVFAAAVLCLLCVALLLALSFDREDGRDMAIPRMR